MRTAALAVTLLLGGCGGDGDGGSSPERSAAAARGLPAPPPADAELDPRFPLPYPQVTVSTYAVGQDVEILSASKWVPAKVVEMSIVDGEQVVRTT